MKTKMLLATYCLAAGAQAIATPFTIDITDIRGNGCPDPSEINVEVNPIGEYYIAAEFNQEDTTFAAETLDGPTARTTCVIDYDLHLAPSMKLDFAEFSIDGEYHLSEQGTAFMSVRHHVPGSGEPTYHSVSRSVRNNDAYDGNFGISGSIEGIDRRINTCGAVIPLQVQIRATARSGQNDTDTTFVGVDNGEGRIGHRDGVRSIKVQTSVSSCF